MNQPPQQPYYGPPPPAPPQPPRKRRVGLWIVAAIIGLIVLCLVGGMVIALTGGIEEPTTAPAPTEEAVSPTQEAKPSPTKPEAAPKKWVTVTTLSGNASKQGAPFKLSGGRTRLVYDVKGGEAIIVAVYLLEEGTNLQEEGGFPEVTIDRAGKDSTEVSKPAGNYFLKVEAANAQWTITVQEFK